MVATKTPTFKLGQIVITPNALESLHSEDVQASLTRHSLCDWGECSPDDAEANNEAWHEGCRILSVYHDRNGVKFWIITEADRSVTTILLPEDY